MTAVCVINKFSSAILVPSYCWIYSWVRKEGEEAGETEKEKKIKDQVLVIAVKCHYEFCWIYILVPSVLLRESLRTVADVVRCSLGYHYGFRLWLIFLLQRRGYLIRKRRFRNAHSSFKLLDSLRNFSRNLSFSVQVIPVKRKLTSDPTQFYKMVQDSYVRKAMR